MRITIAYLVGIIALLVWSLSIQSKQKKKILQAQIVANILYAIQYILIGVIVAGSMNIVSAFKCYFFYKEEEKKQKISAFWLFLFITIILILAVITCKDLFSLIPIMITILYTYATWQKNTKVIRIIFLVAACIWVYYNISVGAYVAVIGNIIEIVSSIVSMFRFDKKIKT